MNEIGSVVGMAWLQYGSFGALVLVLIAVGVYVNRQTERQQVRNVTIEAWMRDLVEADRKERKEHTSVLTELVRAGIETQQAVVQAMNALEQQTHRLVDKTGELAKKAAEYNTAAQVRCQEHIRQMDQNVR